MKNLYAINDLKNDDIGGRTQHITKVNLKKRSTYRGFESNRSEGGKFPSIPKILKMSDYNFLKFLNFK